MKCKICDNETENTRFSVKEMMYGTGDVFSYFQCSNCYCLQISEIPNNIAEYYPDNYYSYQGGFSKKANRVKAFLVRSRDRYSVFGKGLLGRLLNLKFHDNNLKCFESLIIDRNTKVLDVGCGAGTLLFTLSELGMKNILGIDPFNTKDLEYENGLQVKKMHIEDVKGKWNIVMFHHSYEHIEEQAPTLAYVSKLLAPGGRCVIRIPIVSSYAWQHYGTDWAQLDAPRHFFLHSLTSIKVLAEKVGLECIDVVYDSTAFQIWGSEQISKGIQLKSERSYSENPNTSMFTEQDMIDFDLQATELNENKQGDQAIFIFKSKDIKINK